MSLPRYPDRILKSHLSWRLHTVNTWGLTFECIYGNFFSKNLLKKKVVSRYADIVTARVNTRQAVDELIANSSIPVVNALDDYGILYICL